MVLLEPLVHQKKSLVLTLLREMQKFFLSLHDNHDNSLLWKLNL